MLPPTVAAFQILNDASSALQHSGSSGAAVHSRRSREPIELRDPAGRGDVEPGGRRLAATASPGRRGRSACRSPAAAPRTARCRRRARHSPSRQRVISSAEAGRSTSVIVFEIHRLLSARLHDAMAPPTSVRRQGRSAQRARARPGRDQRRPLLRAERHQRRQERRHAALGRLSATIASRALPPISS